MQMGRLAGPLDRVSVGAQTGPGISVSNSTSDIVGRKASDARFQFENEHQEQRLRKSKSSDCEIKRDD